MRNKLIVWTCLQKKEKEKRRKGNVSMKSRYNNNKMIRENEKDKYKHLNK